MDSETKNVIAFIKKVSDTLICADNKLWILNLIESQAKRIEELESLRPSIERRGGQRMADEINALVRRGILDARSGAADASLDWADPDFKRMDEIESLEAELRTLREDRKRCRCRKSHVDVADMYPEDETADPAPDAAKEK